MIVDGRLIMICLVARLFCYNTWFLIVIIAIIYIPLVDKQKKGIEKSMTQSIKYANSSCSQKGTRKKKKKTKKHKVCKINIYYFCHFFPRRREFIYMLTQAFKPDKNKIKWSSKNKSPAAAILKIWPLSVGEWSIF